MPENTYIVSVEPVPVEDGPDAPMLERLATIAAFRLGSLERRTGHYPVPGALFDMLDCLDGKFLWEMTDEELEADPPTRVDFEVVSVEPAERPPQPSEVRVVVRLPL